MPGVWRQGLLAAAAMFVAAHAQAATYRMQEDLAGEITVYHTQKKNNLYAIARQGDTGIVALLAANPGLTAKTLKEGLELTIPGAHLLPEIRSGIVLNLATLRLYYFPGDETVMIFPVSVGKVDWETPEGSTTVIRKRKDPEWVPTDDIREENPELPEVVPAGKDNPLGAYALSLGIPGYAIHGTNSPNSIGKRVSHGCVRLYPADIKTLFEVVKTGEDVTIIDEPFQLGWFKGTLYLEVPPSPAQADALLHYRAFEPEVIPSLHDAVTLRAQGAEVDWPAVDKAVEERRGIPIAIARKEGSKP